VKSTPLLHTGRGGRRGGSSYPSRRGARMLSGRPAKTCLTPSIRMKGKESSGTPDEGRGKGGGTSTSPRKERGHRWPLFFFWEGGGSDGGGFLRGGLFFPKKGGGEGKGVIVRGYLLRWAAEVRGKGERHQMGPFGYIFGCTNSTFFYPRDKGEERALTRCWLARIGREKKKGAGICAQSGHRYVLIFLLREGGGGEEKRKFVLKLV